MFKSLKTRYLVTALIVMILLAVAALVRGEDSVYNGRDNWITFDDATQLSHPIDTFYSEDIPGWLNDYKDHKWKFVPKPQAPYALPYFAEGTLYISDEYYELARGADTVYITDTVYIVDTVYVPIDFKAAAREAAGITNKQMGGEPLKSLNEIKEK